MTRFGAVGANGLLLVAILALFAAEPFTEPGITLGFFDVLVSIVLIAAVWEVSRRPALLAIGVVLAAPALAARWLLHWVDSPRLATVGLLFAIILLAFTAGVVLWRVLARTEASTDAIAGAICVYLMFGVIWGLGFSLVERTRPGSFLQHGQPLVDGAAGQVLFMPDLLYLSLVTLSTVGYGDIVAVSQPARMLAALEAVTGQLYLAVLIARLVGMYGPRSRQGS